MTADAFRKLALAQPGAVESSHQGHADFRVRNKIFATLPNDRQAVVKLTPEQQLKHVAVEPVVFSPCPGAWGQGGWTFIDLKKAKPASTKEAVRTSFANLTKGK